MPDYGHELFFGTSITPAAAPPRRAVELASLTEDVGLDLVSLQDHPYQPAFLDMWTLLSVIAASTHSVQVAPNVANLSLRPPAVLAKSVASLDLLSGGRVELGLGTGAFVEAATAMGAPPRSPAQRVAALEEAIQIIRKLWQADARRADVDGKYYRVHGAKPGPAPAHDVEIWLGAYRKRMLALTGRLADGWWPSSPYSAPDELAAMNAMIDDAAVEAGRQPSQVRRLYNIVGSFTGSGAEFLQGPPAVWAEQLAELTLTEGMSGYVLFSDDADMIRRFAVEVAPAVRELVAAERERPAGAGERTLAASSPGAVATSSADVDTGAPSAAAAGALGVVPTPDDRTRRSDERVWTEDDRPTGPAREGRAYTPHEQASGQHLVDVHDHLRTELRHVRDLVEQVAAGSVDAGAARSCINTMTMRQNNWTLGTYCESYCRVVATHHTIEDQAMFPHLRRADPQLAPVLDRLEEEHAAIHGVLERVDQALVALVAGESSVDQLRAAVDLLTDTMLSHLSYEERELVEPLARLGFS